MLIIEINDMGKRQVKNESALKEIRLPEEGELFGRVLKMMGGENVMIKCDDNVTRRGRIRGKLKRRVWIRDNDIVIIAPWDFKESERGGYCFGDLHFLKLNGLKIKTIFQKISDLYSFVNFVFDALVNIVSKLFQSNVRTRHRKMVQSNKRLWLY